MAKWIKVRRLRQVCEGLQVQFPEKKKTWTAKSTPDIKFSTRKVHLIFFPFYFIRRQLFTVKKIKSLPPFFPRLILACLIQFRCHLETCSLSHQPRHHLDKTSRNLIWINHLSNTTNAQLTGCTCLMINTHKNKDWTWQCRIMMQQGPECTSRM